MTAYSCDCGKTHLLPSTITAVWAGLPDTVVVETPRARWRVPRVYIAAHGLAAGELASLAARYEWERITGELPA